MRFLRVDVLTHRRFGHELEEYFSGDEVAELWRALERGEAQVRLG